MRRLMILTSMFATSSQAAPYPKVSGEETLINYKATSRSIRFQVQSGGCTRKSHFGVETLKLDPLTVRLIRLRPDYCEAHVPQGETIEFTYGEIGAKPFVRSEALQKIIVTNPVIPVKDEMSLTENSSLPAPPVDSAAKPPRSAQ